MITPAAPPPTLTLAQIARRERVRRSRVKSWIESGQLRAVDLSAPSSPRRCYRVAPDDLLAFERSRAVGKPKPPKRKRKDKDVISFF